MTQLRSGVTLLLAVLASAGCVSRHGTNSAVPWDMQSLEQAPVVHPAPDFEAEGVKSLFYEGLPWKGRPTRVFAWYGAPADATPENKAPAVVLAHGGGGTAFDEWVRVWNARGYAAIAMDLEGTLPQGQYPSRPRHEWSGPMRSNEFADLELPEEDQWYYHAVANMVLAHSLLRSFPEVDADRIGLTGISWGGILTCTTVGVDHRFRFAIPVYGCAYVGEMPVFQKRWQQLSPDAVDQWMNTWDPAVWLPRARMPMLWLNGANDPHFPLNTYARSYALVTGSKVLSIKPGMYHGHIPGWEPEEIYAYADSVVRDGAPLAEVLAQGVRANRVWATYESVVPIKRAELVYAKDVSDWKECQWLKQQATIDVTNSEVEAPYPADCKAWFFNVIDARGLIVSSALEICQ